MNRTALSVMDQYESLKQSAEAAVAARNEFGRQIRVQMESAREKLPSLQRQQLTRINDDQMHALLRIGDCTDCTVNIKTLVATHHISRRTIRALLTMRLVQSLPVDGMPGNCRHLMLFGRGKPLYEHGKKIFSGQLTSDTNVVDISERRQPKAA